MPRKDTPPSTSRAAPHESGATAAGTDVSVADTLSGESLSARSLQAAVADTLSGESPLPPPSASIPHTLAAARARAFAAAPGTAPDQESASSVPPHDASEVLEGGGVGGVEWTGEIEKLVLPERRYHDIGPLDEGGMGTINIAKDRKLRRHVAIKTLRPEHTAPSLCKRFVKEAQITAQLDHPNIVPIYDLLSADRAARDFSFSMKLIHGRTLGEVISRAREAADVASAAALEHERREGLRGRLELFLKACDAMDYAHTRGVIHRDLKPANIMVGAFGQLYVMDWGIARVLAVEDEGEEVIELTEGGVTSGPLHVGRTIAGQIIGSPQYMAPEQAAGKISEMDARSDICSLGLILFELVALRRAIAPEIVYNAVLHASEGRYATLRHHRAELSIAPDLEAIIHKACARLPADRYESVELLADDIRRFLHGEEVSVRPDDLPRRLLRWVDQHRPQSALIVVSLLLLSAGLTIWSLSESKAAVQLSLDATTAAERSQRSQLATQRQLQRAQRREVLLSRFHAQVTEQAQRLDNRILRFESQLLSLANTTRFLLQSARRSPLPLFSHEDFEDPARRPADTRFSPLYRKLISLDSPVYKIAPGADAARVLADLQRIAPLRHLFRKMLLTIDAPAHGAAAPPSTPNDDAAIRHKLLVEGVPIRWTYVGLESGVMFSFPGKPGYPDAYDPRARPWYQLATDPAGGAQEVRWGNPYIDLQGQGLILPCAAAFRDETGTLLGVAGLEMTFDDIIQRFLNPDHPGFIEAYLLDEQGRVVVKTSDQGAFRSDEGNLHASLELQAFHDPRLLDSIAQQSAGFIESTRDARPTIIAFQRLPSLRWTFVEEIDRDALGK